MVSIILAYFLPAHNKRSWYCKLIHTRQVHNREPAKGLGAYHHVLPRSLFPEYDDSTLYPWNFVYLTHKEHFVAHHLLYEIYDRTGPMAKAFQFMSQGTSSQFATRSTAKQLEGWRYTKPEGSLNGPSNPFYGKHHTERTKLTISIANTGRKHTEEAKRKMSAIHKGHKYNVGKTRTDAQKEAMRQRMLKFKHTEASKRKISESNRRRVYTEDTRRKLSEAAKVPKELVFCPHCNLARKHWRAKLKSKHFDNCEQKMTIMDD